MEHQEPNTQALPAGTRLEEFVIERVLGAGGFGITYLARDVSLGRQVVIKENLPVQFCYRDPRSLTVSPRHTSGEDLDNFQWSLENFSRESAMLASLDHPGIVKVLRSFQSFGTAYFVMPFVEGMALDELVKKRGEQLFTEEELVSLLKETLSALGYLHDRGIYHRDVKPGNILITDKGKPVLIDFGSARQRLSERSMTVVESAGYTPFEQLQSRGNVGPWSDLYALGATIVKVMTGEAPPKANDRSFGDPWQPLSGRAELTIRFSPLLLGTLDRALKLPIEERWQSAGDWQSALTSGKVSERAHVTKKQVHHEQERVTGKKRVGPKVAAALLVFGMGGAWWFTNSNNSSNTVSPVQVASAPKPGGLVITSEPSGAEVMQGEKVFGKTPLELTGLLAESLWEGRLKKEGYEVAEILSEVISGETKLVPQIQLIPTPQKVIVTSDPIGAEVVEGDKVLGNTPWEGSPRRVGEKVEFSLRKYGYETSDLKGEVEFGKTLQIDGNLIPTPQTIFVTSEPSGAEVLEGDKAFGKTPLELKLQPVGARVNYQLRLEGYEEKELNGEVSLGEALQLSAKLVEKPKFEGIKAGEEREFEIAPGVKMTFCWCPPGEFIMGSPTSEKGHEDDEVQHRVKQTKGFWMGKYEVTQSQWIALGGPDPRKREVTTVGGEVKLSWADLSSLGVREEDFKGETLPVERVSWVEVNDWCERLNGGRKEPESIESKWRYSLPTEAQWEYACRAGEEGQYSGGTIDEVAWYRGNSDNKTHSVGLKKPNAWGLHDMSGNVWEWCWDWYGASTYENGATDPRGAASGTGRVLRGGGWDHGAFDCRAADRYRSYPTIHYYSFGFRIARSSVP